MNFLAFRYFNEVAKTKSIRRAADRLHIAPSAVSRQLVQLEHSLGTPLLERTNIGVQLTAAGAMVERYTLGMFRELEQLQAMINDFKGLQEGEVKLGVIEGVISGFLPRAITEFSAKFPAISFTVQSDSTDRIVEALIRNEIDIGIVFNAKSRPEIQTVAEQLDPVMCLVSKAHKFAGRASLTLAEICSQPIALPVASFGLRQVFEAAAARAKLTPRIVVTANTLELIKSLAAAGGMLTICPVLAAAKELTNGSLKAIPIEEAGLASAAAAICIHRDRPLSYAATAFLQKISGEFRALNVAAPG